MNGGGFLTSQTERLRRGVPGGAGISEQTDVNTGGASYAFTRIRKRSTPTGQLNFKPSLLSRQDTGSYYNDKFGAVEDFDERKHEPAGYKVNAKNSVNETNFKSGFSIVDHVDFIKTSDDAEKQRVISVFKKYGYDKLPDGRAIEDVVK